MFEAQHEHIDRGGQRLCLNYIGPSPDAVQAGTPLELEARGIPAKRLHSLADACGLLDELEELEAASLEDLRIECAQRSLPFAVLVDRKELALCLLAVLIWDVLPPSERLLEARHWGLHLSRDSSPNGIVDQLVDVLWTGVAEARGIPIRRLLPVVGVALVGKVARLESAPAKHVECEYRRTMRRLGLPVEQGVGKQYCLRCLILALVLQEASLTQLKQECQELGLATGIPLVGSLIRLLFIEVACHKRWEARGIPVKTLGLEAAARVVFRHEQLERLSLHELSRELKELGLLQPGEAAGSDERALLGKLKAASIWSELPLEALREQCRDLGISSEASERAVLMARLGAAECLAPWQITDWENKGVPLQRLHSQQARLALVSCLRRLENLDMESLRQEYEEAVGLPCEAGSAPEDEEELRQRLRLLYSWKALPFNELRRECHESGVSYRSVDKLKEEDKHAELVDRLVLSRWADHWRAVGFPLDRFCNICSAVRYAQQVTRIASIQEGLLAELALVSGLPQEALGSPSSEDLVDKLKKVLLWKELSLDDLREECMQLSVSWRIDGSSSDPSNQSEELLERLVMATCAQGWELLELPVRRLSSVKNALQLIERWASLSSMGLDELQREYKKLGLSQDTSPKVLDLLPRLKKASVWQALPLWELQRECRQLGREQTSESALTQEQALRMLANAAWGIRPKDGDDSTDFWHSRDDKECWKDSEKLRSTVSHFHTLGLHAKAGVEEVKRAYRKLILQHHPDKNLGASQEEAAQKFREVTEAYEALCDFMKVKS
eukprot:TRINITY_DN76718_c0_g1_i1.p1 TRINITY_DN76718_c0_g1~~TRINITY_DN76718_c0_g1_i1.p1  ORF type:complete len:789 (+),score=154.15 TRINITY_DN76718_c0_g1_i1:88-2454(+)